MTTRTMGYHANVALEKLRNPQLVQLKEKVNSDVYEVDPNRGDPTIELGL